jgi:DNA-directed RNA polymerase specialized sigma24 family protein
MLPPSSGVHPEDRAIDLTEVGRVRAAVAALPAEQRRAVLLAVLGGHTAKEIAEAEQVPLGTVKSRLRLGLGRLRAELVEDDVDIEMRDRDEGAELGRRSQR